MSAQGADLVWCVGGKELLCKGLGTPLSGVAIRILQLWSAVP